MLSLRPGNVHAALGADDDLEYLVTRLRQAWPDVTLHVRGDCGFGMPAMYEMCEALRVSYTFGLSTNAVLQRETDGLLAEAVAAYERERQAARQQEPPRPAVPSQLFTGFWYQAGTWPRPRWVVAKAEANDRGTNRRFVVTNRPGAALFPGPTYDEYAARGESENRNKEFKCDLAMDRLSDHRFVANYFRLYLHAATPCAAPHGGPCTRRRGTGWCGCGGSSPSRGPPRHLMPKRLKRPVSRARPPVPPRNRVCRWRR